MKIKITLKNKTPLSIKENRADDVVYTLNYIPCHSFLGALASYYLKMNPVDERFQDFFVNGGVKLSPLYPASLTGKQNNDFEEEITKSDSLSKPIPKTAYTCKRWSGFKGQQKENEQHGVRDRLFEWALYALSNLENVAVFGNQDKCGFNGCQEALRPMENFYKIGNSYKKISSRYVKTQISTHTGIMTATGTVSPGILYSIEAIQEGYQFTGLIEIQDKLEKDFKNFLNEAEIRIGNKKTSGQGLCEIQNISDYAENNLPKFKERLIKFDSEFKKFAEKKGQETPGFYFSIDLFSDAIRLKNLTNYTIGFEKLVPEAKLIYEEVAPSKVMGWNSTTQLPKQTEWAMEKGSVAMFQVPKMTDELIAKLYNLERNGIGLRKTEGFGIVSLSDDFHWEVREDEK